MEHLLKLWGIEIVLNNHRYQSVMKQMNHAVAHVTWTTCWIELPRLIFNISQQIVLMCKLSKVCMEYFVACNYFWLLVEAIFLHTLLFTAVLTKRRLLKKYMLLGWGKIWTNGFVCLLSVFIYAEVLSTAASEWVKRQRKHAKLLLLVTGENDR